MWMYSLLALMTSSLKCSSLLSGQEIILTSSDCYGQESKCKQSQWWWNLLSSHVMIQSFTLPGLIHYLQSMLSKLLVWVITQIHGFYNPKTHSQNSCKAGPLGLGLGGAFSRSRPPQTHTWVVLGFCVFTHKLFLTYKMLLFAHMVTFPIHMQNIFFPSFLIHGLLFLICVAMFDFIPTLLINHNKPWTSYVYNYDHLYSREDCILNVSIWLSKQLHFMNHICLELEVKPHPLLKS